MVNRLFLDTSILVGGVIDFGASSEHPMEIFDRIACQSLPEVCTAWHCCLEFYSVVTRLPEEFRLDPTTARILLEEEILPRMRIGDLPAEERMSFLHHVARKEIRGGRIYDAHIGTVAMKMKATILVTENKKHFTDLPDPSCTVLSAKEFLARLSSSGI